MLGAVAEFERSIICERQTEGIARAKARGLIARGASKAGGACDLRISRSALYNHLAD